MPAWAPDPPSSRRGGRRPGCTASRADANACKGRVTGPRVAGASSPKRRGAGQSYGVRALPDAGLSRSLTMADHGVVPTGPATDKAAALLALHAGPGFVLPNAWDAGSARILEQVGFPAIATTSAGIAWSCGVPDGGALDRDTMLEHVGRIVAAVGVPVTADLEAGYGDTADDVGRTVARAVELGAVGANIEDAGSGRPVRHRRGRRPPRGRPGRGAERHLRAERPHRHLLRRRRPATSFAETVERAVRYLEAGADCVFVPGVVEEDTIRRLAAAIPGPLNVVAGLANTIDAPTLFSLGVKRVSLGGSLARAVAQPAGARRPGAARLRHPRLPRRCDRLRRPAATLRPLSTGLTGPARPRPSSPRARRPGAAAPTPAAPRRPPAARR